MRLDRTGCTGTTPSTAPLAGTQRDIVTTLPWQKSTAATPLPTGSNQPVGHLLPDSTPRIRTITGLQHWRGALLHRYQLRPHSERSAT